MKQVYQCEYCDETSISRNEMIKHEKYCERNPENKINNEIVLKLSRIKDDFIDSLIYVLLNDYKEKDIKFYSDEFKRATDRNCPASIYENKNMMYSIFSKVVYFRKNETRYFNERIKKDNSELIKAIRSYMNLIPDEN